ncbi:hypothetical protein ZWY2020_026177 [Hordeum vulgare]|nr:hypothetical protein ZWY2020_026177 [Hordeum vulgare]
MWHYLGPEDSTRTNVEGILEEKVTSWVLQITGPCENPKGARRVAPYSADNPPPNQEWTNWSSPVSNGNPEEEEEEGSQEGSVESAEYVSDSGESEEEDSEEEEEDEESDSPPPWPEHRKEQVGAAKGAMIQAELMPGEANRAYDSVAALYLQSLELRDNIRKTCEMGTAYEALRAERNQYAGRSCNARHGRHEECTGKFVSMREAAAVERSMKDNVPLSEDANRDLLRAHIREVREDKLKALKIANRKKLQFEDFMEMFLETATRIADGIDLDTYVEPSSPDAGPADA